MARGSRKTPAQRLVTADSSNTVELDGVPDEKEEIKRLAFQFWLERGSPIGTPEEDWYRAEAEAKKRASKAARVAANG